MSVHLHLKQEKQTVIAKRFELKYVLKMHKVALAESYLMTQGRLGKSYDVSSIYFDDYKLSAFHAKVDGLYERQKIRIRSYSKEFQNSPLFLEQKKRRGEFISKNRIEISDRELSDALSGKSSHPWLKGLGPQITVYYRRKEFLFTWGRITIDTDITFKSERFEWNYENAILEIKTETEFESKWFRWLDDISHVQAFSKYATAIKYKRGEDHD